MNEFLALQAALIAMVGQPLLIDGASNIMRLINHMVAYPGKDYETELRSVLFRAVMTVPDCAIGLVAQAAATYLRRTC